LIKQNNSQNLVRKGLKINKGNRQGKEEKRKKYLKKERKREKEILFISLTHPMLQINRDEHRFLQTAAHRQPKPE